MQIEVHPLADRPEPPAVRPKSDLRLAMEALAENEVLRVSDPHRTIYSVRALVRSSVVAMRRSGLVSRYYQAFSADKAVWVWWEPAT